MATWQRTGVDFGGANQAMANAMRGVTQAGEIAKGFVDRIREDDRELQRQKEREQDVAFREKDFSLKQLAADREAKKFNRELETEKQLGSMAATLSNGLLPEEQIKIADMAKQQYEKGVVNPDAITDAYNKIIASRTPQQQLALSRGYVMPEGDYNRSALLEYRRGFEDPVLRQMSEAERRAFEMSRLEKEIAARRELEGMRFGNDVKLAKLNASLKGGSEKLPEGWMVGYDGKPVPKALFEAQEKAAGTKAGTQQAMSAAEKKAEQNNRIWKYAEQLKQREYWKDFVKSDNDYFEQAKKELGYK